ncbi:MAG TPA: cysteine desulfurase-like protein [Gemmatimonadales bacterium]|nr:cysteine desulfurase-like protein [Gemmatimonadales bacterium]
MATTLMHDVEAARACFPALLRRQGETAVAYFDGPGGTQVPRTVVEAMSDYLYHHNANTHWAYPTSQETDQALAAARAALADLLGAAPDEIAFGANMTTLTFHLARALGRGLGPGDEIVVTELDHQANVAPWQAIARERGVSLRVVPFDPATGELVWPDLLAAIGPRTRVVAVGAASNALGTVTDVRQVAELAARVGAISFIDAVHFAAHARIDVSAIGCDFLACSAYKFYGPHVGVLFGRRDRIAALEVPKLDPAPETSPERLETGTQNHEGIVGAHAAVDFLAERGSGASRRARLSDAFHRLHAHGQHLVEHLWDGLARVPGVRRLGPPPTRPRTPTVSFSLANRPAEQVARQLAQDGLFVSHGDFYATQVARRLGLAEAGLIRVGCACYSTAEEVDRLLSSLARIAR